MQYLTLIKCRMKRFTFLKGLPWPKRGFHGSFIFKRGCQGVVIPHDDALLVMVTVANHTIQQITVNNGSSADILYWLVFKQKGIGRDRIKPFGLPSVGFFGEQVQPIGHISLPLIVGTAPK